MSNLKELLLNKQPPKPTKTYSPISNKYIYEEIVENLEVQNCEIVHERFYTNKYLSQMNGVICFETSNEQLKLMGVGGNIYFRNSYDKTKSAMMSFNYSMLVCSNGLFGFGNTKDVYRIHKGDAANSFQTQIYENLKDIENNNEPILEYINKYKSVKLTNNEYHTLIGEIALSGLPSNTFSLLKSELNNNPDFNIKDNERNLFNVFNCFTEAIKGTNERQLGYTHMNLFAKRLN